MTSTTQSKGSLATSELSNADIRAQISPSSQFREVGKVNYIKVISVKSNLLIFSLLFLHVTVNVSQDIIASIVGSALCIYSGQPFDTLKVRLQVQVNGSKSAYTMLQQSIANEGFLSLWKGSVPAFSGALAENAAAFATNGLLTRLLAPVLNAHAGESSATGQFITGGITGALTTLVLTPFDILKCRAQLDIARGNSSLPMSQVAAKLWRTQGPRGFYVGFASQVMRDCPFYAFFFGSYEISCQLLRKYTHLQDPTVYLISGG
jgi:hypothetical protein